MVGRVGSLLKCCTVMTISITLVSPVYFLLEKLKKAIKILPKNMDLFRALLYSVCLFCSLHEEVMAQRALDRRLTEELMRFKSTISVLTR